MGLDGSRRPFDGDGFDDVGIERALDQKSYFTAGFAALEFLRFFAEDGDEFTPNAPALFFGIRDPLELSEKTVGSIHSNDMEAKPIAEHVQRLFEFVFAQHTGVNEDVGEPVAHGAMHEHGGHRRIHSAAKRAKGAARPPLFANRSGGLLDKSRAAPLLLGFAHAEKKISQDFRSLLGVSYLRMEFHRIDLAFGVFHGSNGIFRCSHGAESRRQSPDVIAVAVPHAE